MRFELNDKKELVFKAEHHASQEKRTLTKPKTLEFIMTDLLKDFGINFFDLLEMTKSSLMLEELGRTEDPGKMLGYILYNGKKLRVSENTTLGDLIAREGTESLREYYELYFVKEFRKAYKERIDAKVAVNLNLKR